MGVRYTIHNHARHPIMIKGFYHNRFWDWIQKQHTKLGNWLWAKRWRNFEK